MALRLFILSGWLAVLPVRAQLPKSGTLSVSDWPLFRAEVARLETAVVAAPDKDTVTYEMARTWASAKQWPEAMDWLRQVAAFEAGLDPSRDSTFTELRGTKEFAEVMARVREATPPLSHSRAAFQIAEGDLVPESMAYDPRGKRFYFGSMRKGKVVRCAASGDCGEFASGLGEVLGLKAAGAGLWVLSNSERESALLHYELASGRVVGKFAVAGGGHEFNDLVVAHGGEIYLTDTRAGKVWFLGKGRAELKALPGAFPYANGVAMSPDGRLLYVSTFPDGITVQDLRTGSTGPVMRPAGLCLGAIDGLYFHRGALIAIQNGFMTPRVVRLILAPDLRGITRFEVLERRNPLFDGITTGVVAGNDFFYMANIQDDKKADFDPIAILKLLL